MQNDLTRGNIFSNIIRFSLPYFLAYFLQNFYGMADLFITGQYNGAEVITAVSCGSQIMHFVTVFVVGLAMGTTVVIGHAIGAGDESRKKKAVGNTITLFLVCSLIITLVLLMLAGHIVSLMQTPLESRPSMLIYITICFSGVPFITAYNVIASIFRGMGDSKTPMFFVMIACILNIMLDYLFIGGFSMGAAGAALGTILSQAVSVLMSIVFMIRKGLGFRLTKHDLRPDASVIKGLIVIGAPIACQDGFIQVSFLVITAIANSKGVEIAAAVGIVEKIITFLFLVPSSMLSTVSAMGAQCVGAEKYERARKTLFTSMTISCGIGFIFFILFQMISEPVISLFTKDEAVIVFGTQYLTAYVIDCVSASTHFCFSGYFSACGLSIWSFIHNALSILIVRIPGFYLMGKLFPDDLHPWGYVAPIGGLLSLIICLTVYLYIRKKTVFGGPDR